MSLNQIINPIKPLDVVFGNITANNLEGSETRILKDIAGADFVSGDNVSSSTFSSSVVYSENKGDLIEGTNKFTQRRIFSIEAVVYTPSTIVVGKEGLFEFTLIDPAITTEYVNIRKNLVAATGLVNNGGPDFLGNFYLDASSVSAGQIVFKFISVFGALKPSTQYKVSFDVDFTTGEIS